MREAGALESFWFDGHSPKAHAVTLRIEGAELLVQVADSEGSAARRYPGAQGALARAPHARPAPGRVARWRPDPARQCRRVGCLVASQRPARQPGGGLDAELARHAGGAGGHLGVSGGGLGLGRALAEPDPGAPDTRRARHPHRPPELAAARPPVPQTQHLAAGAAERPAAAFPVGGGQRLSARRRAVLDAGFSRVQCARRQCLCLARGASWSSPTIW